MNNINKKTQVDKIGSIFMKSKKWFLRTSLKEKFAVVKSGIINSSWKKRIIILVIIVGISFLTRYIAAKSQSNKVTYETSKAEKGTLVTSISGSGTITSGNYTNITTKISGVVSKVYVTNGDAVAKGQKIAEVSLDDYAKERQAAAWVAYLEATEAVKGAQEAQVTADIQMWGDRQAVIDAQTEVDRVTNNLTNPDTKAIYSEGEKTIVVKTLDQEKKALSTSEAKYLNAGADIANTQAKVVSCLRDYQENSATIIALSAGVISDLSLASGLVVNVSSTTSSTSGATIVSAQTVGKINNPKGQLVASVSLTEMDIINVKANQKVTLTLDTYPDKTFTGKVLAVNTSGSISSGVTSYPVTILLDPVTVEIYPNMAVSVEIITDIKTDVLLIPSTAIQTANDQSTLEVMKSGKVMTVQVEIGSANDSQTEIISGLNEGDEVVISTITSGTSGNNSQNQSSSTSPFSGIGRTGTGGSGNSGGSVRFEGPPGGF